MNLRKARCYMLLHSPGQPKVVRVRDDLNPRALRGATSGLAGLRRLRLDLAQAHSSLSRYLRD